MRIFYDHQIFSSQKYGGISRYFLELIKNLPENIDFCSSVLLSHNYYLSQDNIIPHLKFFPNTNFKGKVTLMRKINEKYCIKKLKDNRFDIFHPTYYNPYFLKYICKKPFILTIHDMAHEKFPQYFSSNTKVSKWKKLLAKKASHIITVSERTKQDLIELYGASSENITTIYHGFNLEEINDNNSVKLPEHYLLYVGDRKSHKNFNRFITAYSIINKIYPELKLITTGNSFTKEEILVFKKLTIEKEIFNYSADDSQLKIIYKNAEMFIFPSLYEGFGLPVLEAMGAGCPNVLSNLGSLPEIARDAGEYFDPYSVESIVESIESVLTDENYKKILINNGYKRIKNFSWEKTAEQTVQIYMNIFS